MYINKSFSNGYTIPKREYLNTLLVSAWKALCHTANRCFSPDTLHLGSTAYPDTLRMEAPLIRRPQNRQGRPRRLCENTGRVVERRLSAMRVLWRALPMPRLLGMPLAPMSKAAAGCPPSPGPPAGSFLHPAPRSPAGSFPHP